MKFTNILISSLTLLSSFIAAVIAPTGQLTKAVSNTDKLKCAASTLVEIKTYPTIPGFSFYNKTNKPIIITVLNETLPEQQTLQGKAKQLIVGRFVSQEVPAFHFFDLPLSTNKKTTLNQKTTLKIPEYKKEFTFTPGKTIYVSWGKPEKSNDTVLYPQTGFGTGKFKVTDLCYGIKNNVTKDDIILVK